nr:phospholipase-like protein [Tanacetum cinerariifolium]
MDAVRVCLILVAELVFVGKEDKNCIPRHLVSLVGDVDCWNDYPWDSNPNLELYATPLEQQTEWFKASIEYINGLVNIDMNVSEDDIGGDVLNNSFDLNYNAVSGNGNNDVLLSARQNRNWNGSTKKLQ